MFFKDYRLNKDAKIRKSLLWEYNTDHINWKQSRNIVVQRVIERGRMNDFYAILNLYQLKGVKDAIRQIPSMNNKDITFVCSVFNLKKEELKCFTKKQLTKQHWNS
jgi:hypothetical protein